MQIKNWSRVDTLRCELLPSVGSQAMTSGDFSPGAPTSFRAGCATFLMKERVQQEVCGQTLQISSNWHSK
jgi:hypothetical protein